MICVNSLGCPLHPTLSPALTNENQPAALCMPTSVTLLHTIQLVRGLQKKTTGFLLGAIQLPCCPCAFVGVSSFSLRTLFLCIISNVFFYLSNQTKQGSYCHQPHYRQCGECSPSNTMTEAGICGQLQITPNHQHRDRIKVEEAAMPLASPDFELFDLTRQVTVCWGGWGSF